MRRLTQTTMAASMPAILIASLAGCSEKAEAVPELPARICWGAFAAKEVSPLLPSGQKATFGAAAMHPFALPESADLASCTLDIDGTTKFQASATRLDYEKDIDWSPWEKADPEPLAIGEKGILWYDGAASYIVCEPSVASSSPGRYIDLHLSTFRSQGDREQEKRARRVLPVLLKQFVAFAEKELKCR
ncbi:hypothetical protein OHT61_25735 [Streptomyces sp. NBC_00178]|uniref:hypothetical protein n=1 Tax=Streptomyces sp. NBC_00178 TaxID=2975672 RepID=UPI002E2BD16E|nr:hypothetical protein [Streptomyces sp. NBC_00178]